ncbi:hypothetical protein [Clostridium sp. BJN0001]|uniref:hypothetical protein n=1 Tax=Clostridium sp. BJN0001 TaxID=2930219 RepID=UPI001FD48A7D|nr:hypothetical protein [Clostridium sp. BJN0001]
MGYKYSDDDYCDIYENKICDNCGKCLEMNGIDTKAIKIEDIAKNKDENKILEEEYMEDIKADLTSEELDEINEENLSNSEIYKRFMENNNLDNSDLDGYEDAFDHIDYETDVCNIPEDEFNKMTDEVYPGVKLLKKKINK